MKIQQEPFEAKNIASKADVETMASYEERIDHYAENDYTYIPIPEESSVYDIRAGELGDIEESQFIDGDASLMAAIRKLESHEFLLIDLEPNYYLVDLRDPYIRGVFDEHPTTPVPDEAELFTPDDLREAFPELADQELRDYDARYMIITASDLNKRRVREMLYVVIGGVSAKLSSKIEVEHPESRALFKYLRPGTIGRWEKENLKDLHLHIAEHMTLLDMMQVVQGSSGEFVRECGFESKSDVETLNQINSVRNHVMHPNRSLIRSRDDIPKVIDAVEESQRILENMA